MMKFSVRRFYPLLISMLMLIVLSPAGRADPIATFVDSSFPGTSTFSTGQYDFASVSVSIDPATTLWAAWNNASTVSLGNAGCSAFAGGSAGHCLGPGGFATDDSILLTVTNPLGNSVQKKMDQNDAMANSFGPQNVIFGTAADAPDVVRSNFSGVSTFFDEAGAFNSIFTTAGTYKFDFSFQNDICCSEGHPDIYLLVEPTTTSVPEPATLLLFGTALAGLACTRLRRWKRAL